MNKVTKIISCIILAMAMTACANYSGSSYNSREARSMQEIKHGVVTRVRSVQIEGESSGLGTVAGAVAGGVLGSQIGGGSGRIITGTAGAIAGGVIGNQVEKGTGNANGLEITVRLDDSKREVVVVQGADVNFSVGERVSVVYSGNTARVTR